ncbi:GrpB family protein [Clostridium sp. UBA6640]|uniref:GrpB family protein n=1 Tax=Clostridium sp. UBA6640 TaxID=1946370 RepID=UPI0025C6AB90|nr:GrpB family protein [Clostridium sp. UBA6640]
MIGLKRGIVKLAPYTYEWKEEYNKEEKLLHSVIGKYVLDIQHVGSTSIEGLDAKPIIDIAVAVESLDKVECFKDLLEDMGYQYGGNAGVEGRLMFAKGSEDLRTHYLHIETLNGPIWKNHIYFRDYLRLHKEYIHQYLELKRDLAEKFEDDRYSYTNEKDKFISMVLEKAKEEFS